MQCAHCHGPVVTSKKPVLGLHIYWCRTCERKNVEGSALWVQTGPGHEAQLRDILVEVAAQDRRMQAFLSGEFDGTGMIDIHTIG
jgi:hypothetical protein